MSEAGERPRRGPAATIGRALFSALAVLALLAVVWTLWIAAHIGWYRYYPPGETAFMAERLAEARAKNPKAAIRYTWVPYARISPNLKRAMVAAEDAKFTEHAGFDWDGIESAYEKNRRKGQVIAGGSTITQQLAKNLFLSPAKSYWRKGMEAVITVLIEAILPKRRILELYLNVIEWGSAVFGAEAAAQRYYSVSAANLSAEQAARLAAMAPSPRLFERRPDSTYLAARTSTILARMSSATIP